MIKNILPPTLDHCPALFASFSVDSNVQIGRMIWKDERKITGQQTCIWVNSLNVFENLLGRDVLDLADSIINYDHEFLSRSDPHQIPSLVDALVHTTYAAYPDCDPSLRIDRRFDPLPYILTNFRHLTADVIKRTSRIYSRKNPRGRALVTT